MRQAIEFNKWKRMSFDLQSNLQSNLWSNKLSHIISKSLLFAVLLQALPSAGAAGQADDSGGKVGAASRRALASADRAAAYGGAESKES